MARGGRKSRGFGKTERVREERKQTKRANGYSERYAERGWTMSVTVCDQQNDRGSPPIEMPVSEVYLKLPYETHNAPGQHYYV